jgi:hypothetical protein
MIHILFDKESSLYDKAFILLLISATIAWVYFFCYGIYKFFEEESCYTVDHLDYLEQNCGTINDKYQDLCESYVHEQFCVKA